MSARFKVGDEVLVRAKVRHLDIDGMVELGAADRCFWLPPCALEPATRAPWGVLREAAALIDGLACAVFLRKEADRLEAAARPPSLLEAAKDALKMINDPDFSSTWTLHVGDRLRAAIAAAEKENSQ